MKNNSNRVYLNLLYAGVAPAEAAALYTDLSHTLYPPPPQLLACQCLHHAYHKFQPTSHGLRTPLPHPEFLLLFAGRHLDPSGESEGLR